MILNAVVSISKRIRQQQQQQQQYFNIKNKPFVCIRVKKKEYKALRSGIGNVFNPEDIKQLIKYTVVISHKRQFYNFF